MYYTTGFSRDQILDLCTRVKVLADETDNRLWPPILGLFRSMVIALTYMRRNRVQWELAETYDVSQSTVSRAIARMKPFIAQALEDFVPTADDLDPQLQYVVDGTLLPCWSWRTEPQLYSGKHKTTGLNVQVACTLSGRLAWISDPFDGARHDSFCLNESGVLVGTNPANWIADKGYVGNQMLTPIKKPVFRELLDWEKEYNSGINKIRWVIEQVIADLKNWRILHVDYRRPIETFRETISVVVALQFYKLAAE